MNDNELLLDVRDLSVQFDTDSGVVHAVNHLNLQLREGHALGFVGETGAGKTTTALAILQLIQSRSRAARSCSRGRTSER